MVKEIGSSKSKSYISPSIKEELRSAGRHHHHSPRNSTRRAYNNPSISHVKKYKRRFGGDELQGEINNIKTPTFDGEYKKYKYVETWMLGMRRYFQLNNYSLQVEGRTVIYQLMGKASLWWDKFV